MAEANDGEWFAGWEMRESFLEGAGKRELRSSGRDAEDGFAEAEGAVGGSFEGLRGRIVCRTTNDDLHWMMSE